MFRIWDTWYIIIRYFTLEIASGTYICASHKKGEACNTHPPPPFNNVFFTLFIHFTQWLQELLLHRLPFLKNHSLCQSIDFSLVIIIQTKYIFWCPLWLACCSLILSCLNDMELFQDIFRSYKESSSLRFSIPKSSKLWFSWIVSPTLEVTQWLIQNHLCS